MYLSNHKLLFCFVGLTLVLLSSCGDESNSNKKQNTANQTEQVKPALVSPNFNSDSAYLFVQEQVNFGPRFTNSEGHTKCGNWLVSKFTSYADKVYEQNADVKNFDGKTLHIRNIIASFNPDAKKRVIVAAHWDSRPYADQDADKSKHTEPILAADDAGSGVAVMLEMARVMSAKKPQIGIDLICFDAEDLGKPQHEDSYCLGSQYWSKNPHLKNYKADYGILLDMVGGRDAKFVWESFSVKYAESTVRKVWDQAVQLGYSNYFYYYQGNGITDDHYYVNKIAGIPMIDIIHYSEQTNSSFPPHWHTLGDNMNVIDRNTLKAVGQSLLEVVYKEK
jgi:Zn-dependent M28 family amino/carboxypeptidase